MTLSSFLLFADSIIDEVAGWKPVTSAIDLLTCDTDACDAQRSVALELAPVMSAKASKTKSSERQEKRFVSR